MYIDLCESCFLNLQEFHTLPYTCIGYPGPPVPAEHVVSFSDLGEAPHRIRCPKDPGVSLMLLGNVVDRRPEGDHQLIVFFQKIFDRILPRTVHVVDCTEFVPVESDIRDRVEAVEAKDNVIRIRQFNRINVKCAVILKVVLHKRQSFQLIIPVIGIVHGTDV